MDLNNHNVDKCNTFYLIYYTIFYIIYMILNHRFSFQNYFINSARLYKVDAIQTLSVKSNYKKIHAII